MYNTQHTNCTYVEDKVVALLLQVVLHRLAPRQQQLLPSGLNLGGDVVVTAPEKLLRVRSVGNGSQDVQALLHLRWVTASDAQSVPCHH